MNTLPLTDSSWTRRSLEFPEHTDYLVILPQVGRMIVAAVIELDPVRYGRIAMFYRDVEDGVVQMRDSSRVEWTEHRYRLGADQVVWDHGMGWGFPWKLIPSSELPSWFPSFLAKAQWWLDGRGM